MREYGRLKSSFWRNPKIRSLSCEAKLLAAYLISCPHGNSVGCFVLPLGYVADDMGWDAETVSKRFAELFQIGFFERDEIVSDVIRIPSWWEHNTIENGNVLKHAVGALASVPNCQQKQTSYEQLTKLFQKWFRNGLANGHANG